VRLQELSVRNFRALEDIHVTFRSMVDVIVGPNAVGKTTILEAIRITKAILSPRVLNEGQQALISLGAISPHLPQQINFAALARDTNVPLVIRCKYELNQSEVIMLDGLAPAIVNLVIQSQVGPIGQDRLSLVQFLSSPQGRAAVQTSQNFVSQGLDIIKGSKVCTLELTFDPQSGNFSGADPISQVVIAAFELHLPPNKTLFSYFPADRAMPIGEVGIQIGGPDVSAQLLSYNSQPQTKFQRMKTTIINNYLLDPSDINGVTEDFRKIFSNLMKDREMLDLKINDFGLVSVRVKDLATNQIFDLDGMSSGEKGLILTFLLIGRSLADGGIVLIDEPELHLNPAVCKILLPFLIEGYLKPLHLQAIICSHSPEILGVAFDRLDCSLHHLQSPTVISPIFPQDKKEVFDALRRLGTSTSDVLFSSGSIFVEGDDDIEILDAGFATLLNRYNVKALEGRGNVEREIRTLQEAERHGKLDTLKCFIFDLDQTPTNLASTALVRVSQWDRRCIENYLISETVIYDLLRDDDISQDKIETRGEVPAVFREIALSQLTDTIASIVFRRQVFASLGPPPQKELFGKSFAESAELLFNRISAVQGQICAMQRPSWSVDFQRACEIEQMQLRPKWEAQWITLCDGKRFFHDLQARYGVKVSPTKLKVRIMERLARERADEWVRVEGILKNALRRP
jgi:predicted ATPase